MHMFGQKTLKDFIKNDGIALPLNDTQFAKLRAVAELRGERVEDMVVRLVQELATRLPNAPSAKALACADLEIDAAGEDCGSPFIKLRMGRTFYGLPSEPHHLALFMLLADRLPPQLTPATYHLATEIQGRYLSVNYRGMPGPGGVIVEAGAYIGLKAIRFADIVGPTGKVVAIEMMPDNAMMMDRNVQANGLEDSLSTVHCGLWNEPGEVTATSKAYQQNSLVELDGRKYPNKVTVKTDTLDNIFDRLNVETVDFLNMQINGAELEAVEGLKRRINDVRLLRIASYYKRNGEPTVDACCKILTDLGCDIINRSPAGSIYASPKHFATDFAALRSLRSASSANQRPRPEGECAGDDSNLVHETAGITGTDGKYSR